MSMKSLLLLACLCAVIFAKAPRWHELQGYTFEQYTKDFGKRYSASEVEMRSSLFYQRLREAQVHNEDPHLTWKRGINRMSDWTSVEIARINGLKVLPRELMDSKPERIHTMTGMSLPYSVDYRTNQPPILTAVKDQGQCGSCWAHSATEAIETYWAMATGKLMVLSQQEINACTPNPRQCGGTGGCGGNIYENAFDLAKQMGMASEWTYSYTSYWGNVAPCNMTLHPTPVNVTGYTSVPSNNVGALMDAIANVGPLSISVDASAWSPYEAGIFTGCTYNNNISMDHAVMLVGYGHDADYGMDYWLVRNSWSAAWGEAGFIRLARNVQPLCGWNVNNTNGNGCLGGPNTVWACGMCGIAFDAVYPNVQA